MKIGFGVAFGALLMAGACASPDAPQSRGVGFDDYSAYELDRARREAQLTGSQSIIPAPRINTVASPTPMQQAIPSADLARAGIGQMQPAVTPFVPAAPAVSQPVAAPSNNTGISDEQSFDAVAGRETIQSDAERRAAQAAAREQVQPTAVPQRPSNTGPNIVEYAINAPNVKGQEWYSRSLLTTQGRYQRNCADYSSPDEAQRDFLARGGPERDRRGIDPDGDGFACGWDPAPFK